MSKQDRPTIILAEDDEASRALLVRQLRSAGHEVIACGDGAEALAALRAAGSGIIVADWNMPNMDGLELCRAVCELREMTAIGTVYFILLTANTDKRAIVQGLEAGADDYLTKPYHCSELLARIKSGERVYALQQENWRRRVELERKNAELDVLTQRLERLANTDALTGLHNRRYVLDRLKQVWDLAARSRDPFGCIVLDVDHFKKVNDLHGHAAGDAVLVAVAEVAREAIRSYDLLGRIGGEEFLIVCPQTDDTGTAVVAERVRSAIQELTLEYDAGSTPGGGPGGERHIIPIRVTVSLGVAGRRDDHASIEELLAEADAMLYRSKASGRNQTWMSTGPDRGVPVVAVAQPA